MNKQYKNFPQDTFFATEKEEDEVETTNEQS